jgi:hypothetical protein
MAESHLILLGAEGAYLFLMCGSEFFIKDGDQQRTIKLNKNNGGTVM